MTNNNRNTPDGVPGGNKPLNNGNNPSGNDGNNGQRDGNNRGRNNNNGGRGRGNKSGGRGRNGGRGRGSGYQNPPPSNWYHYGPPPPYWGNPYGGNPEWANQQDPQFFPSPAPPSTPPTYWPMYPPYPWGNTNNNNNNNNNTNNNVNNNNSDSNEPEIYTDEEGRLSAMSPAYGKDRMDPTKRWADQVDADDEDIDETQTSQGNGGSDDQPQGKSPAQSNTSGKGRERGKTSGTSDARKGGDGSSNTPKCSICSGEDHGSINCPKTRCYKCGGYGHIRRLCPNRNNQNNNNHPQGGRSEWNRDKEAVKKVKAAEARNARKAQDQNKNAQPPAENAEAAKVSSSPSSPPPPLPAPPKSVTDETSPTGTMLHLFHECVDNNGQFDLDSWKKLDASFIPFLVSVATEFVYKEGSGSIDRAAIYTVTSVCRRSLLVAAISQPTIAQSLLEQAKRDPISIDDQLTPRETLDLYDEKLSRAIKSGIYSNEEMIAIIQKFARRMYGRHAEEVVRLVSRIMDEDLLIQIIKERGRLHSYITSNDPGAEFSPPPLIRLPEKSQPKENAITQYSVSILGIDEFKSPSTYMPPCPLPGNEYKGGQTLVDLARNSVFEGLDGEIQPSPFSSVSTVSIGGKFAMEMVGSDPGAMENAASIIFDALSTLYPGYPTENYTLTLIKGLQEGTEVQPEESSDSVALNKGLQKKMRDPLSDLQAAQSSEFKTRGPRALTNRRNWVMGNMLQYLMEFLPRDDALIAYIKLEEMAPDKLLETLKPQQFHFFLLELSKSPNNKPLYGGEGFDGSNQLYDVKIKIQSTNREGFGMSAPNMLLQYIDIQQELAKEHNHIFVITTNPNAGRTTRTFLGEPLQMIDTSLFSELETQNFCYGTERTSHGKDKSFSVYAICSHKGTAGNQHNIPLSGRAASIARSKMEKLQIHHFQREIKLYGQIPCMFFLGSNKFDEKHRAKAELLTRLPELQALSDLFKVCATTITINGSKDSITPITVSACPSDHERISEIIMRVTPTTDPSYVVTQNYVPVRIDQSSPTATKMLQGYFNEYRRQIGGEVSIEIAGLPPSANLSRIFPEWLLPDRQDELNTLSITALLLNFPVPVPGGTVASPVTRVTPTSKAPRCKVFSKTEDAQLLLIYCQHFLGFLRMWLRAGGITSNPVMCTNNLETKLSLVLPTHETWEALVAGAMNVDSRAVPAELTGNSHVITPHKSTKTLGDNRSSGLPEIKEDVSPGGMEAGLHFQVDTTPVAADTSFDVDSSPSVSESDTPVASGSNPIVQPEPFEPQFSTFDDLQAYKRLELENEELKQQVDELAYCLAQANSDAKELDEKMSTHDVGFAVDRAVEVSSLQSELAQVRKKTEVAECMKAAEVEDLQNQNEALARQVKTLEEENSSLTQEIDLLRQRDQLSNHTHRSISVSKPLMPNMVGSMKVPTVSTLSTTSLTPASPSEITELRKSIESLSHSVSGWQVDVNQQLRSQEASISDLSKRMEQYDTKLDSHQRDSHDRSQLMYMSGVGVQTVMTSKVEQLSLHLGKVEVKFDQFLEGVEKNLDDNLRATLKVYDNNIQEIGRRCEEMEKRFVVNPESFAQTYVPEEELQQEISASVNAAMQPFINFIQQATLEMPGGNDSPLPAPSQQPQPLTQGPAGQPPNVEEKGPLRPRTPSPEQFDSHHSETWTGNVSGPTEDTPPVNQEQSSGTSPLDEPSDNVQFTLMEAYYELLACRRTNLHDHALEEEIESAYEIEPFQTCFKNNLPGLAMQMALSKLCLNDTVIVIEATDVHRAEAHRVKDYLLMNNKGLTKNGREMVETAWADEALPVIFVIDDNTKVVHLSRPITSWVQYRACLTQSYDRARFAVLSSPLLREKVFTPEFNSWFDRKVSPLVENGDFAKSLENYSPGPLDLDSVREHTSGDQGTRSPSSPAENTIEDVDDHRLTEVQSTEGETTKEEEVRSPPAQCELIDLCEESPVVDLTSPGGSPALSATRYSKSPLGNLLKRPNLLASPPVKKEPTDSLPTHEGPGLTPPAPEKDLSGSSQSGVSSPESDSSSPQCEMCGSGGFLYQCSGTDIRQCSHWLHSECAQSQEPFRCKWCVGRAALHELESDTEVEEDDADNSDRGNSSPSGHGTYHSPAASPSSSSSSGGANEESPFVPSKLTRGVTENLSKGPDARGVGPGSHNSLRPSNNLKPPPAVKSTVLTRAMKVKLGTNAPT